MSKTSFLDATPKLARMLADENLTVVHGNYETASFDTSNRVLRLPIFKDQLMNRDLYTMFVAHEVGHALETPKTWNHDLEKEIPGCPQQILNIVEDIRIEKLIRRRYSGLYKTFVSAYASILDMNLFGVQGMDISKLGFLNRLNLHAKAGDLLSVPFNEDEQKMVDIAMQIQTWDDTLRVTKLLKDFAEEQDRKQSNTLTADGGGSGEEGEEGQAGEGNGGGQSGQAGLVPPVEMRQNIDTSTDKNFRKGEVNLTERKEQRIIRISRDDVKRQIKDGMPSSNMGNYKAFQRKFKPFVQRMVQQFNMRVAARKQMLNTEAKSGRLDPLKLPEFAYNEDIFVRYGVDEKQQNHSVLMFVDCSSSMRGVEMRYVALQAAIMTEFCRTLSIPFKVYGWTTAASGGGFGYNRNTTGYTNSLKEAGLKLWIDSTASTKKYKEAIAWLYALSNDAVPVAMGGTPLTETKAVAAVLAAEEKQRADKVHVIMLTDGQGYGNLPAVDSSTDSNATHRNFFIQMPGVPSRTVSYPNEVMDERAIDDMIMSICDHYMHIDVGGTGPSDMFTETQDYTSRSASYSSVLRISNKLRRWAIGSFDSESAGNMTSEHYRAMRKISGLIGKFLA